MRFVSTMNGLVTRAEIAAMLYSLAPDHAPATDYQRGYTDALERVAKTYGVVVLYDESPMMVEVTR